jgi:hypothetical protein
MMFSLNEYALSAYIEQWWNTAFWNIRTIKYVPPITSMAVMYASQRCAYVKKESATIDAMSISSPTGYWYGRFVHAVS